MPGTRIQGEAVAGAGAAEVDRQVAVRGQGVGVVRPDAAERAVPVANVVSDRDRLVQAIERQRPAARQGFDDRRIRGSTASDRTKRGSAAAKSWSIRTRR
jgi:hypothetical protein